MLNIPATVKSAMTADTTRKNFRVMFKSGRSDLTLSDIVNGSVSFTESICSQNVLKFGCVEASTIEFETVGVENIMGEAFNAGWEIDLSSLSAAQLSAIALNPGDGVYVPLADSDLGYPYYRVPCGEFVVTGCPRNHEAMTHRQITAESTPVVSPFTLAQLVSETHKETWTESPRQMVIGMLGCAIPNIDTQLGFTSTTYKNWTTLKSGLQTRTNTYIGTAGTLTVTSKRTYPPGTGANYLSRGNLNLIEMTDDFPDEAFFNAFASKMRGFEFRTSSQDTEQFLKSVKPRFMTSHEPALFLQKSAIVCPGKHRYIIDVWDTGSSMDYWDTTIVSEVSYTLVKNGVTLASGSMGDSATQSMTISTLTDPSPTTALYTITATSMTQDPGDTPTYGHVEAFDPLEMIEGWAELNGWFISAGRDGNWRLTEGLPSGGGATLSQSEYSSAWWDDYELAEVGRVRYPFQDTTGSGSDDYALVTSTSYDDYGLYDLTSNAILTSISNGTKATVLSMVQTYFVPNLANIIFYPADVEAKNRPDIQPGDKLTVTASTTFSTVVTRQTISGEQLLSAAIESLNGIPMEG